MEGGAGQARKRPKQHRSGYAFFFLVYTPVVMFATREMAEWVVVVAMVGLFILPYAVLVSLRNKPSSAEVTDERSVIHHGTQRKGTWMFKAMVAASAGLLIVSLLGGGLVDGSCFELFPWSTKAAFLAMGLYVLSPVVPVTRTVLSLEGDTLRFISKKHPLYSTGYKEPSEIDLHRVTRARFSFFPVYQGESAFYLVLDGDKDKRFPGSTSLLAEIWIDATLGSQAERFIRCLHRQWPAIDMEISGKPEDPAWLKSLITPKR